MTTLNHRFAAFELRSLDKPRAREHRLQKLRLRPTGDGWSLLGPRGELVFHALGTGGRRACLEVARDRGAVVVFG